MIFHRCEGVYLTFEYVQKLMNNSYDSHHKVFSKNKRQISSDIKITNKFQILIKDLFWNCSITKLACIAPRLGGV